jgi:hypothetical protein
MLKAKKKMTFDNVLVLHRDLIPAHLLSSRADVVLTFNTHKPRHLAGIVPTDFVVCLGSYSYDQDGR